ncbi:MAG: hypothetical protein AABZ74_02580 [Cyanobacteriota bacterium]
MVFSKRIELFLLSVMLVSIFTSCSSSISITPVVVKGNVSFSNSNVLTKISNTIYVSKNDPNHFYLDASSSKK